MVSNKKYKYALEMWNEWETMATDVSKQNGVLLKEMKEINDLSMRVNEHNGALIAECRRLRKQLDAAATAEKELYKSFIARLIHCTDGARYEEDVADDYCRFVDEMCAEYKEKYGEEVE